MPRRCFSVLENSVCKEEGIPPVARANAARNAREKRSKREPKPRTGKKSDFRIRTPKNPDEFVQRKFRRSLKDFIDIRASLYNRLSISTSKKGNPAVRKCTLDRTSHGHAKYNVPQPVRAHDKDLEHFSLFLLHPSSFILVKSGRRGSNPRRSAWEADILPLNYSRAVYSELPESL